MQEHLLPIPPEHDPERLRKFEADFTPLGVVRQMYERGCLLTAIDRRNRMKMTTTVVHPNAGCGAYAAALKPLVKDYAVRQVCIEIRPEEREHLLRWTNEVAIGDAISTLSLLPDESVDIVADNPAFSMIEPLLEALVPKMRLGGYVVFLGLSQWGQSAATIEALHKLANRGLPLVEQWRVGGRIKFRGKGGGADAREYSHWVFQRREPGVFRTVSWPRWMATQFPELPACDRQWSVRPGTEEVDA